MCLIHDEQDPADQARDASGDRRQKPHDDRGIDLKPRQGEQGPAHAFPDAEGQGDDHEDGENGDEDEEVLDVGAAEQTKTAGAEDVNADTHRLHHRGQNAHGQENVRVMSFDDRLVKNSLERFFLRKHDTN